MGMHRAQSTIILQIRWGFIAGSWNLVINDVSRELIGDWTAISKGGFGRKVVRKHQNLQAPHRLRLVTVSERRRTHLQIDFYCLCNDLLKHVVKREKKKKRHGTREKSTECSVIEHERGERKKERRGALFWISWCLPYCVKHPLSTARARLAKKFKMTACFINTSVFHQGSIRKDLVWRIKFYRI